MFFEETDSIPKSKYVSLHSDPNLFSTASESDTTHNDGRRRTSSNIIDRSSCEGSPFALSPWNQTNLSCKINNNGSNAHQNGLIGSMVREEGHIYSLAARNGLLYTGSDSKNIRIWKNLEEFSGFKSNSGLVKTIVISGEKIFTGHQDGKIRVWKVSSKNPNVHRRAGTLPTLKDILKNSMRPSNYVEVRRRRSTLWIKHTDAVSCLSLDEGHGLLYSASWDRSVKVWRISDSKCLESIKAHDDAVNSVVAASDAVVLTGSADGSIKAWRREFQGERTSHTLVNTLLKQDSAITAVAVSSGSGAVYCGSSDGVVNHWDWTEKYAFTHGGSLKGHKLAVLCLAAAGSLLFSGSADKTICVWRNEGGGVHTCVSVLSGHMGPVKCLAVEAENSTEDGYRRWVLYSGSLDKSVKVWGVPEFDPDFERTARMMPYQQQHEVVYDGESYPFDDGFSSSAGEGSSRGGSLFM